MSRRGMTLIELMVALVVTSVAIAAATALTLSAAQVSANTEQIADGDQGARLAQDLLDRLVRQAGMGASGGVWVTPSGGTPLQVNPVFGADGTIGPTLPGSLEGRDDLWLVEPSPNAFRESCVTPGAATLLTAGGPGGVDLQVSCSGAFGAGQLVLVTNMDSAALLANVQPTDATTLGYADEAAGFSDAPNGPGFQVGDWVYGVSLLHFFIATDPLTGRPGLYEAQGQLVPDALGRPFSDVPNSARLVQRDVEDLQIRYGFDPDGSHDPTRYVFSDGLAPAFRPGLRTVRVSVVSTTAKPLRSGDGALVTGPDEAPQSVENHAPAPDSDGHRRGLLQRRVEIPNMATEVL